MAQDPQEILNPKERLVHRDLSWLAFNERVLDEANDPNNPLMERLRFLAIFVSNLDEFFMVRVAGLKRLLDSQYNKKDAFGYYPPEIFAEIKTRADGLIKKLYEIYKGKAKKDLEKNKIFLKKYDDLDADQQKFVKRYFDKTLFPVITPLAVDQGHPFPVLKSKTIAFAVTLERQEKVNLAIITIPKNIPRVLKLPVEKDEMSFILIDDILKQHLAGFFRGFKILGSTLFRVIRDSELTVSEEDTPDILKAIAG